jgi:mono/diheme cytochrome c family protein
LIFSVRGASGLRLGSDRARSGQVGSGRFGRIGRALSLSLSLSLGLSGCTKFENVLASIPVFSYLRNAPFFDPYEAPRPAPANSVPYASPAGESPGPIPATEVGLTAFGAAATNPLPANDTLVLNAGRTMYDRHCAVCHGAQGGGNGPIVGPDKFPPLVPNLTLPRTVTRTDGYLYGVIAAGRGLMPPYGSRMTHAERWATVSYVRQLQRASGAAAPAPVPAPPAQTR